MAEEMVARTMDSGRLSSAASRTAQSDAAAERIADFIRLVWGDAGPEEYAPGTLEMLYALQGRVRGMDTSYTWQYALVALCTEMEARLGRAAQMTIDPEMETGLLHHFFDSLEEYEYLHDVARNIMSLHWQRRHSPESVGAGSEVRPGMPVGPRGQSDLETHLRRVAMESLATYIEQSNIARGHIEKPTDPMIVMRDRIDIQMGLGGKNAETWAASGWQLADLIESRFGTAAGRRKARLARVRWKSLAKASS